MALTKIPGELFSVGDLDISDVGTISLDAIEGDADSNTSITFSGSDVITIATGGSNRLTIGDGALSPVTDNQIDLGTSSLEFKDAYFDGTLETDNLTIGGAQGSDGQVLTSTGSGVAWEDASSFNADAAQTFNDSGAAVDFRIESDSDANMFFLDGSANAIGMGTSTPNECGFQSGSRVLTIQGAAADDFGVIELLSTDTTSSNRIGEIRFGNMDATNAPVGMAGIRARRNGADNTADLSMWTTNAGTFAERLTVGHTGPVVTITDDGTDGYETLLKLYRSSASANEVGLQFDLAGSGGAGQAVAIYASKGEDWSSGTSRSATLNFQCKDDGTDQIMYQFGNFSDGVNQHKFYTEGAERMRILQGGGITFNGDTATANALNDYEEGTWTPTVGGNTGQGSTSSGSVAGKYIKIGKLVTASFSIANITIANASGHLKIGGFPFNNDGTNDREANGVMRTYGVDLEPFSDHGSPVPAVNNDTNTAFVLQSKDNAAWAVVQVDNGSGQYFEGTITYITT